MKESSLKKVSEKYMIIKRRLIRLSITILLAEKHFAKLSKALSHLQSCKIELFGQRKDFHFNPGRGFYQKKKLNGIKIFKTSERYIRNHT